ncbi:undecaprenyl-diphosphatase UppP [Candidatus Peregrinibacteria bacterium]|nr:undecaprenyl-diphosphatase UppP [Candidatus Peregrinibacteria bacterium]
MTTLQVLVLGVIQGITEFLPISSSGHLVLVENIFGLQVEALKSFDIALHFGTLLAIFVYFWRDFAGILLGIFGKTLHSRLGLNSSTAVDYRRLLFFIIIGTIPAVLSAIFFEDGIDRIFRNPASVLFMMIAVGVLFFFAEKFPAKKDRAVGRFREAIFIGLAQSAALIPGVSRSGATISAGLFQGIRREESARFSFLLGAPAIFGAGLWTIFKNIDSLSAFTTAPVILGFTASLFSGLFAVSFLMRFLKNHSLRLFGFYRIAVGVGGLILLAL